MTKVAEQLHSEALRLTPADRAELVRSLLHSFATSEDHDTEAAWDDELQRRMGKIESGMDPGRPATEIFSDIRARVLVKPLIVHRDAEEEFNEAIAFYENRVKGLGLEFAAEIGRSFTTIQHDLNLSPFHKRTKLQRFVVERFPYIIFYRNFPERISIVAIAHAKRRPDYWRFRRLG